MDPSLVVYRSVSVSLTLCVRDVSTADVATLPTGVGMPLWYMFLDVWLKYADGCVGTTEGVLEEHGVSGTEIYKEKRERGWGRIFYDPVCCSCVW
jgi:hypothetical protein